MDNRILKTILTLTVIMPFMAFAEPNGGTRGYECVETEHQRDTLSRTYNAAASLPYGEGEIFAWEDIEPGDEPSCGNAKFNERIFDSEIIKNAGFRTKRVASRATDEIAYKDITLSAPGTLASMLGDDINEIDSLVVRGPINAEDLHTIWSSSFYGRLTVANLEYTQIAGNRIPKNAFWYQSEQYTPGSEYIDCIPLRRIILPEGLEEIGEGAFCYAIDLEDVNFPSSLKAIRRRCFSDCISLNVNPLVIPEGVEEIGYMAFVKMSIYKSPPNPQS